MEKTKGEERMNKSKLTNPSILLVFLISLLAGCTEMTVGSLVGISEGSKNVQHQQIRYCGPDGKKNWEIDKSKGGYIFGPNFDKLCGKSAMRFISAGDTKYAPTTLSKVEIYKKINHLKGQNSEVKKNDIPNRPYIEIGTLKFPKRWYYASTINNYMVEKMSEIGAHAILEYNLYQDSTLLRKNELNGEMLNVYHMYMEATLIRYSD